MMRIVERLGAGLGWAVLGPDWAVVVLGWAEVGQGLAMVGKAGQCKVKAELTC